MHSLHIKNYGGVWHLVKKMKRKLMNGFQEGSIFNPFFIPLKKFSEEKMYDTSMPPQKVFKNAGVETQNGSSNSFR